MSRACASCCLSLRYLQLILFGFAVNLDISDAQIAWMDMDQTPASTHLRAAFDASPTFTVSRVIAD